MLGQETPPPNNPPTSPLKRMFGWWKWPGYSTAGLGVLRLFHFSEDVDFALGLLRSLEGYAGMIGAAVASPFFGLGMVLYGVLHLLFVGEPKQASRHRSWIYLGWAIFGICLVIIVATVTYGMVQVYIQREVGKRDQALQVSSAVRPVYWHLTDIQKTSLALALDKIPDDQKFPIKVICLPDSGSRTYVEDLAKVFLDKKWIITADCLFSDLRPDMIGLSIGISPVLSGKKLEELPKNVQTLAKIINDAQIPATWSFFKQGAPQDDFSLVVGNAPGP